MKQTGSHMQKGQDLYGLGENLQSNTSAAIDCP
jgi:hypothetical protein